MKREEAKRLPLDQVLKYLGYSPVNQRVSKDGSNELLYFSPLREEKKSSFWVNKQRNIFQDFGYGGGNVIDFVMAYHKIGFKEALSWLKGFSEEWVGEEEKEATAGFYEAMSADLDDGADLANSRGDQFRFWKAKQLYFYPLKHYIKKRGISLDLAKNYLVEVEYYAQSSPYKLLIGIGMRNDLGGFEVRSFGREKFYTSLTHKGISSFAGRKPEVVDVFESALDFLSFLTLSESYVPDGQAIVLHSTSLVPQAVERIRELRRCGKVRLWMDNDRAGQEASDQFQVLDNEIGRLYDMRYKYKGCKDLNEWLLSKGTDKKKGGNT